MNRFNRMGSSQKLPTSFPYLDGPIDESLSTDTDTRISDSKPDLSYNCANFSLEINDESLQKNTFNKAKEKLRSFIQLSNNKQALKLFGNKSALDKEKLRQRTEANWIIHPCSGFRFCWNSVMVIFLIISVVELPIVLSFFNEDANIGLVFFHCACDILFLLDIIINMRTGVLVNSYVDEIILSPRRIFFRYMKTWFIFDFVSSVPFDYIYLLSYRSNGLNNILSAGKALLMLRRVKILGTLRLLRIFRLVRYIQHLQEILNISNRFVGTFNIIFLMILLSHWNACLQFLIPMLQDFPKESWVLKCELLNEKWTNQYTWCLFNAISHMLSIGYGRYPPTSPSEAWLTIISVLTGVTCYALFVGHAAALIYSFDTSKRLYNEKFKQIKEYMAYMKLPKEMRQKIVNYYEYRYQGKIFNEGNILEELSECLREEIINYNCRDLVAAVPIFRNADQNFITDVLVRLKYEVYQPGNLIIKEGTIGTKMYFILDGVVDVTTKEKEIIASLSNGGFFGEICLLTKSRRMASILARTHCSIYSLDRMSFMRVLEDYPAMRRYLEKVAAERLEAIGKNPLLLKKQQTLQDESSEKYCAESKFSAPPEYVLGGYHKRE